MVDLTKTLPVELLAEILGHASVSDIFRSKQVDRAFRDAILLSPLIQHKIDLYAAGFKYNPAAGIDLAESRKALHRYLSSLDSLCPIEERSVKKLQVKEYGIDCVRTAGGVIAIVDESLRLFVLGSSSRGIPYKEWEIPLPPIRPGNYGFYPGADIIAFVELQVVDTQFAVHLRTLSSGGFHPSARCPTIPYSPKGKDVHEVSNVSISSSRLAVLMDMLDWKYVVIWDWRSSQVLFAPDERYYAAELIDDYRLLVSPGSSKDDLPCLMLMDTEKDVGGAPVQTSFHLPPCFRGFEHTSLHLERGMHEPSSAEYLAPFHQDHTQRIAVLSMPYPSGHIVFSVEALLRLAGGREGCKIEWDEWKIHALIPSIPEWDLVDFCVSGCRLFSVTSAHGPDVEVKVYDFSIQGRAKYLSEQVNASLGGVRYLTSTGTSAQLPWHANELYDMGGGHDSVAFFRLPFNLSGPHGLLRIWSF